MLLERPQIHQEFPFMGRENSVMNEHVCLPPDLRKFHDIIEEEPSKTSMGFFRRSNIEAVHQLIIDTVLKKSGGAYKIGRQSDREVETLMLYVYMNRAGKIDGTAVDRVRELNRFVAHEAASDIIVSVTQYLSYMKRLTTNPPTGPPLPEAMRDTGKGVIQRNLI